MFTEPQNQAVLNLYRLFETRMKQHQTSLDLRIPQTNCRLTHFIPSNNKMTELCVTQFNLTQETKEQHCVPVCHTEHWLQCWADFSISVLGKILKVLVTLSFLCKLKIILCNIYYMSFHFFILEKKSLQGIAEQGGQCFTLL